MFPSTGHKEIGSLSWIPKEIVARFLDMVDNGHSLGPMNHIGSISLTDEKLSILECTARGGLPQAKDWNIKQYGFEMGFPIP